MLNNPSEEIKNREAKENEFKKPTGLFTKSRILFLIVALVVFSMPLAYRYLSFLL